MAVIISQIRSSVTAGTDEIIRIALRKTGINESDVKRSGVHKTSLDARDNKDIKLVSSVMVEMNDKKTEKKLCSRFSFCSMVEQETVLPDKKSIVNKQRVVIAGFGPAGMFAALTLAEYGFEPIVGRI